MLWGGLDAMKVVATARLLCATAIGQAKHNGIFKINLSRKHQMESNTITQAQQIEAIVKLVALGLFAILAVTGIKEKDILDTVLKKLPCTLR